MSEEVFRSAQAERAVVGAVLLDPNAMASVVDIVSPADFVTQPAKALYAVIAELWERQTPADMITVGDAMDNPLAASHALEMVSELEPGHAAYVVYYARLVASQAERRRFVAAAERAAGELYEDPSLEVDAVLSRMAEEVASGRAIPQMQSAEAALDRTIEAVTMERAGVLERTAVTTGFPTLDRLLGGGFEPGELIVLAARSSMGKTSLASDFLVNAALGRVPGVPDRPGATVMFSAEMSTDQIMRRMASRKAGISMQALQLGQLSDEEYDRFMAAANSLQGIDLYVDDTPAITTAQMQLRIQRIQMEHPVRLVVFDYMELVGDEVSGKSGEEGTHAKLTEATKRMKAIARFCDVPVVVLSQVSRSIDNRPNKVPMLSDLRWTGMLEQTADKVLMMYLHDYYVNRGFEEYDAEREGVMEIHVQKNRNGPEGMVPLGYDAETSRFWDLRAGDGR